MLNPEDLTPYVKHVDWHRNGVGGEGFYVAIVRDPKQDGREMLIIDFEEGGYCATLALDALLTGNVYMQLMLGPDLTPVPGTGGNAWRGDNFQSGWHDTIKAVYESRASEQSSRVIALIRKQQAERQSKEV